MSSRAFIITVHCNCGERLLKYKKRGKGRLIKIHAPRITKDYHNLFQGTPKEGENVYCPHCGIRFATVKNISGKWVYKINTGALGLIRK